MESTIIVSKNSSEGFCGSFKVTPKSSANLEDQPFIRSFQVKNEDLDDEDARLDLSYARPYDFLPGEPVSYRRGHNIASPLSKTGTRSLLRHDIYEATTPVSPTVDDALDDPNDAMPLTPPSMYGDHVTITTLTLSSSEIPARENSGLVVTNSSRNVGCGRNRTLGRGAQTGGMTPSKRMSKCVNSEAKSSKERGSDENSQTDSGDGPTPRRPNRSARSRQRRSFFRAVANNDDTSLLSPLRNASKVKVSSIFQRVAATAMSSRLVPRARKAGTMDLTVPFAEGLCITKEILQNDYRGTVSLDAQTELRMQIVISCAGKPTLCNIFVSGEEKPFGCRLWVRRSVADSVRGGNDDFDRFTLSLHQQLTKLLNPEN